MSGKGPGSEDLEEFWNVVATGQGCHEEIPTDRFNLDEYYCVNGPGKCTMTCRHGCFIKNPGHFDPKFFHISPREALLMDPNHRLFLMNAYEALETAGYSAGQTKRTDPDKMAVFFGQSADDWHKVSHHALGCDAYTMQCIQRTFGPGRLAFQMKWEGPTYALDSACAGATSCIHLACMSLLSRDVDMAVAGATNVLSDPHSFTILSKAGVLSETGNCKTYRDDADGYCRADFSGVVVLKRLEDAIAHNDNILAVIASSPRNHSGNSTSITTSDANAQERLFNKVLRNARLAADDVSYIEMHGTGTQVGDKAEMGAVSKVFAPRPHGHPLQVGAIKANIGHSEAAAGMSSVLKSILMLQNGVVPPQAGMPHSMNPKVLKFLEDDSSIVIPTEPTEFISVVNNFDAAARQAVDFRGTLNAIRSALKDPVWLEIGPGPVCTSFVRATLSPPPVKINHSIDANTSNWASVSKSLAAAYTSGADVDWLALHSTYESNLELLPLPTYAWDVKDYWITHTDKNNALLPASSQTAAQSEPFLATTAQYLVEKSLSPKVQVTFRVARDGLWGPIGSQRDHFRAFFVAMNEYTPAPMTRSERPARTAVIWAERGLVNRVSDDPALMQKLAGPGRAHGAVRGLHGGPRAGHLCVPGA
ncbi:hypothetical protein FJTKL_08234 [Diaporthe vaccinii]|uniref:Ketosynthase family 3 (KS3) domain-containing protein n=1 Tax=Diaporthe vaccinii TaxID=105482 RepID=A0ABR4ES72_9PEZI